MRWELAKKRLRDCRLLKISCKNRRKTHTKSDTFPSCIFRSNRLRSTHPKKRQHTVAIIKTWLKCNGQGEGVEKVASGYNASSCWCCDAKRPHLIGFAWVSCCCLYGGGRKGRKGAWHELPTHLWHKWQKPKKTWNRFVQSNTNLTRVKLPKTRVAVKLPNTI